MEKNHLLEALKYISLITYIGSIMAASTFIGFFMGSHVQRITGSFILFIVFIFLGVVSGFWSIYQLTKKLF